jgi:hypothetical protein
MPKITARQMTSNHRITGDWCPGCGLYAFCNGGQHRADCTKGRKLRAGDTPAIPNVDNRCAQHAGPDTPGGPNP